MKKQSDDDVTPEETADAEHMLRAMSDICASALAYKDGSIAAALMVVTAAATVLGRTAATSGLPKDTALEAMRSGREIAVDALDSGLISIESSETGHTMKTKASA